MSNEKSAKSFFEIVETLFSLLEVPSSSEATRFSVAGLPGHPNVLIGKDASAKAVFLINAVDQSSTDIRAPLVLQNLMVQSQLKCRLAVNEGTPKEGRFAVVSFTGTDFDLQKKFLLLLAAVFRNLPKEPSSKEVEAQIDKIVELFRADLKGTPEPIQSVWAELFVIAGARDKATLAKCWHSELSSTYDFSSDTERIEVKSTSSRRREHEFSIEQLNPPTGTTTAIASILVERDEGGKSVIDLVEEIRDEIFQDTSALAHFEITLARALQAVWSRAAEERFDYRLATDSIRYFDTNTIPSVPQPIPKEISHVRFRVNLEGIESIDRTSLASVGRLFESL